MGQVGLEPTMVKPTDLQSAALAARRLTHIMVLMIMVGQVGLEPTTALSTGFTVRGDTNYTVLTHMVEPAGVEPATPRFSVWRSTS